MRSECEIAETAVSFLRRMAQGRLDLIHAYLDRRTRTEILADINDYWVLEIDRHIVGPLLDALPSSNDTPDQQYFRATYHVEFKSAFDAALATLTEQQRDLLRLRFVEGLALETIGERYEVHKTTAFRWLEEAQTALTKRTHNNFQQRTRATVSEMRSIVRVLESNVELSLRRVLAR